MENSADFEQGSSKWFAARYGNASASRIKDVIAKTKSGYSASRENYMTDLVLERFDVFPEQLDTVSIRWGKEQEPFARAVYEVNENTMVQECGFILHPSIEKSGASPDGLIGDDGVLEIKCCNTKNHFEIIIKGEVPEQYKPQMAWQCAVTKRKFADFVAYDPRAPEGLQYFCKRYFPDTEYIELLESEVVQFLKEVDDKYNQLKEILDRKKNGLE